MKVLFPLSALFILSSSNGFCLPVTANHQQGPLSSVEWTQWASGLCVVLILILACAWLLRKFNHLSVSGGATLKIMGGISVGARERIVLLKAGKRQLLVGVSPGRIQALHIFEEGEIDNEPMEALGSTAMPSLAQRFHQAFRRD